MEEFDKPFIVLGLFFLAAILFCIREGWRLWVKTLEKRELQAKSQEHMNNTQVPDSESSSSTVKKRSGAWAQHCKCARLDPGTYEVLETNRGAVEVVVEDGDVKFLWQGKALTVSPPAEAVNMTVRLWHSDSKERTMKEAPDGNLTYQWQFCYPTCGCAWEYIHHNPGECRVVLLPSQSALSFTLLKESESRPIGPP